MRSVDSAFYNSKRWRTVAAAYKKAQGGLCERCKAKGIYSPAEIIHHREHLNPENIKDPRVAYGFGNLEALCRNCHNLEHFGAKKERRYEVGEDGKIIF